MGGLVVDYPNSSKAKKYYLCLGFDHGYTAPAPIMAAPDGKAVHHTAKSVDKRHQKGNRKGVKAKGKVIEAIVTVLSQQPACPKLRYEFLQDAATLPPSANRSGFLRKKRHGGLPTKKRAEIPSTQPENARISFRPTWM